MNMFRQDFETVFIHSQYFGSAPPLPSTILPDHPTYHQSRTCHFLRAVFCLAPEGSPLRESDGGGTDTF